MMLKGEYPLDYISEQELVGAQVKRIKAEAYLKCGLLGKEFAVEAKRRGMTRFEFWRYCKKCISAYERIVRWYNLSHAIPTEYDF